MTRDPVRVALRELAQELAPLLPARAEAIASAFETARARPESADARESLRLLAHRMRGTAGSHGFHALSKSAGLIEDRILSADGTVLDDEAWVAIAEYVQDIRDGAARAPHEIPSEGP
jgi:HPt (histidine-containing phosphotransfer) domain-containing protein